MRRQRETCVRCMEVGDHDPALARHARQVVEIRDRIVEALRAEEDFEGADVALLVEGAKALRGLTLRESRAVAGDPQLELEGGALRAQRYGVLAEARELPACGRELLVERIEAENRRARPRLDRRVACTERRRAVRRNRAADRRDGQNGEGDCDEGPDPPSRRVCLPKHGAGPYHSREEESSCSCRNVQVSAEKGSPC